MNKVSMLLQGMELEARHRAFENGEAEAMFML